MRSKTVAAEDSFGISQFFGVDEFEGLSPNVVKCSRFCFETFIRIADTEDPHFSEVNEVRETVGIILLHFDIFGVVVKGKADLPNGGRLLVLCCIDNEALK